MSRRTAGWALALAAALPLLASCSAIRTDTPRADRVPGFDVTLYDSADRPDLELEETGSSIVDDGTARALRVRYSFVAYRGYPGERDVRRATATLFLPLDKEDRPRASRAGEVLLAEFPPGSSRTGFDVLGALGQRTALEADVPCAIVDVRGPVLRDLGSFVNQDADDGSAFRSEDQFAYAMLRSYALGGRMDLLWEQRLGEAWLRAIRATDRVLARHLGTRANRFVLAGERWGALGAVQAAAVDGGVEGVVICGWPLDRMDLHFVAWRRWERDAGYFPLADLRPSAWQDSRDVLSFLSSTWGAPDPGCPSCEGDGASWRAQFEPILLRRGPLEHVPLFVIAGDSDPALPVDLLARVSAPSDRLAALPPPAGAPADVPRGPFSGEVRTPFVDLAILEGSTSTLAHPDAARALVCWMQHLGGYHDLPGIALEERIADGNVEVTVVASEGNASVISVELRVMEIGPLDGSDFMHSLHRADRPESPAWRAVEPLYTGHDRAASGRRSVARWTARFPYDPGRNQAYYAIVRTRVGADTANHSLPIRVLWSLGDPALGPARL